MRSIARWTAICIGLLICFPSWATCNRSDTELSSLDAISLAAFVKQNFEARRYDCAVHAMELKARSYAGISTAEAADGRFALRNAALTISKNGLTPIDMRIAVIRAAITRPGSPEDVKFDTLLALKAGEQFKLQGYPDAQLDAMILAIETDRSQTTAERFVGSYQLSSLIPQALNPYIERLATIAELTRGDPAAADLRARLARATYYNVSVARVESSMEATLKRCEKMLQLIGALDGVEGNKRDIPLGWRWKPTLDAALCYYNAGQRDRSIPLIDQSLQMVRDVADIDVRLSHSRSALIELLGVKYDRTVVKSFADETLALTQSRDTDIAKEVREMVSQLLNSRLTY